MRLKKIKINGFKSFLETATIDLKTNMVAIVGPNGCGKSNVIEALTWVLGETSAKQLRGGQMDDVIFNGNTTKNPIGRASVELILENAEGILGDKYSGFNEISIRRELDRNSASNYSINGVRCRRRDVADLFLGTGLGSKQQYSIIGQGMVTQLVESKPDDLRLFIEEAAGVSRYKERKRETLNKIKSVNENLGRIQDIKSEVEKQLKKLDRQAKGAESYKKLKLEEGRLKSLLSCLIWNQYDKNRSVLMKKKHVCEKEVNEQQSQLIKSETESDLVSEKIAVITESLNKTKEEFYKSDAVIAQLRNQYMANKKEHSKLLGELAEKENSEKLLKNEMNIQKKKINELELIISDAVLSYQAKHQTLRKKKEELSVLSNKVTQSFNIIRKIEAEKNSLVHSKEASFLEINFMTQLRAKKLEELKSLEKIVSESPEHSLELESNQIESRLEKIKKEREDAQRKMATCRADIEATRGLISKTDAVLFKLQKKNQEDKGKLSSLKAIQSQALGENDDRVNDWLKSNNFLGNKKLLGEIRVHNGWERAFEKSFSLPLNTLCIKSKDFNLMKIDLDSLPIDLYVLFDDIPCEQNEDAHGVDQRLEQKIDKASDSVKNLSRYVKVVDSNEEALKVRTNLKQQQIVVSKAGVVFGKNWCKLPASSAHLPGLIVQNSNIKKLTEDIDNTRHEVDQLEKERDSLQTKHSDAFRTESVLNKEIAIIESKLLEFKELQIRVQTRKADLEKEIAAAKIKRDEVAIELNELEEKLSKLKEQSTKFENQLEQLLSEEKNNIESNESLTQQQILLNREIETLNQQLENKKNTKDEQNIQVNSLRNSLEMKTKRSNEYVLEKNKIKEAIEFLPKFSEEEPDDIKEEILLRDEFSREVANLDVKLKELEQSKIILNNKKRDCSIKLDTLKNNQISLQSEISSLQGKQEALVETQEFDPKIFEDKASIADLTVEKLEEESAQVVRKIERLGPINLAAIDEFEELDSRQIKLESEIGDLTGALSTLTEAMRKIEQETKSRFSDMYEKINQNLKVTFVELFGGGNARLEMTSDNLLETGVTIIARPPGKRNTTINQLSGGEKALTALALIFTIFKLKPAPFCLLDEVDAPLDDSNALRFATMLKKMSTYVQFLYVTHNKITMEAADQLLGVTMEEAGISRLVNVNIIEAIKMAKQA